MKTRMIAALSEKHRTARRALRIYLAEHETTLSGLCEKIALPTTHTCSSIRFTESGFKNFRYRLRIEREIGAILWTDPEEFEQLQSIGKTLGVDIFTVPLKDLRGVAWRADLRDLPIYDGPPEGFPIFRELIRHFFPNTQTINAEHYNPKPE